MSSLGESYHRVINKYCPKNLFFGMNMKGRVSCSVLDWNERQELLMDHELDPVTRRRRLKQAYQERGRPGYESERREIRLETRRVTEMNRNYDFADRIIEELTDLSCPKLSRENVDLIMKKHNITDTTMTSSDANRFFKSIQH